MCAFQAPPPPNRRCPRKAFTPPFAVGYRLSPGTRNVRSKTKIVGPLPDAGRRPYRRIGFGAGERIAARGAATERERFGCYHGH